MTAGRLEIIHKECRKGVAARAANASRACGAGRSELGAASAKSLTGVTSCTTD